MRTDQYPLAGERIEARVLVLCGIFGCVCVRQMLVLKIWMRWTKPVGTNVVDAAITVAAVVDKESSLVCW